MLGDADPRVRESAVRIAGYFGYRETGDRAAARARDDPDESVRRAALEHLPFLDDPRVLGALVAALQADTRAGRGRPPARALSRLDEREAAAALRRALEDADGWVRYYAVARLGGAPRRWRRGGARRASAIGDPAHAVRIAAVEAAGAIGARHGAAPDRLGARSGITRLPPRRCRRSAGPPRSRRLRPLLEALRSEAAARRAGRCRGPSSLHGSADAVSALEWTAVGRPDRSSWPPPRWRGLAASAAATEAGAERSGRRAGRARWRIARPRNRR